MDEIEKRNDLLKKYEDALTKLDSLDNETKELVREAIRRTMFELRNEISMIERNRSMSYFDSENNKVRQTM